MSQGSGPLLDEADDRTNLFAHHLDELLRSVVASSAP